MKIRTSLGQKTIPHPCRGCKGGAFRIEAGIPGRWEFTALFRLRFGGVGWSAVGMFLGQQLHLLVEIVLRDAKTFQSMTVQSTMFQVKNQERGG
jgi:hypothetical protein